MERITTAGFIPPESALNYRPPAVSSDRSRAPLSVSRFFSSITRLDAERILVSARRQRVAVGDILFQAGDPGTSVFFPERTTIISTVHVFDCGALVDTGLIGDEGVAGLGALLGGGLHPVRAVVQSTGAVWRVDAGVLAELLRSSPGVRERMDRFISAFSFQLSQTAACNRIHRLEKRMARALLMIRDRNSSDEIRLTHDSLAQMLGARRAGVTLAIGHLAREGSLAAGRGRVRIVAPEQLGQASCECYRRIAAEYAPLMGM